MMTKKNVDIIVDMQYGSTGKGLIAGWLAKKEKYDVIVNANMPNAGHTFIDDKGQKMMHKVLPNGIVSPHCTYVLIGPGSVFKVDQLISEIKQAREFGYMENAVVLVHPMAVPLQEFHTESERKGQLKDIGSTQQGSMEAMSDKLNRSTTFNIVARDMVDSFPKDHEDYFLVTTNSFYNDVIKDAYKILAEGAQGFSLGINEQFYPFCTSRDCGPARFLSDMAIPVQKLRRTIGTARTFPIRVGGTSGPHYSDQEEITWESLGLKPELTTVTKRQRRIFTFSHEQIKDAMWAIQPTYVFLNFCNYVDDIDELNKIMAAFGAKVTWMGYGPGEENVVEI